MINNLKSDLCYFGSIFLCIPIYSGYYGLTFRTGKDFKLKLKKAFFSSFFDLPFNEEFLIFKEKSVSTAPEYNLETFINLILNSPHKKGIPRYYGLYSQGTLIDIEISSSILEKPSY